MSSLSASTAVVYGAALASAGMWGAALGYGLWPLGWVAFLPLWMTWHHLSVPRSVVLTHTVGPALLVHLGAYVMAYPWVIRHATSDGIQAGVSATVLLACLYSLPLMAGGRLAVQERPVTGSVVWLGGWMLVDLLIQRGSWAFPWVLGAHAVVDSPGTYTLVRLGGPVALTVGIGLVHLGATAVLCMLQSGLRLSWRGGRFLIGMAGCAGLLTLITLYASELPSSTSLPSPPATVWAVQPNMQPTAWARADNARRRARLHTLTEAALDTATTAPDLIVWPETALHLRDTTAMQATVHDWEAPVLTGAVLPASETNTYTNAALLYHPTQPVQQYNKHHLVPFAEAVPGASWWRALHRLAMQSNDARMYVPGPGATVFSESSLPVVPLVCFESLASPLLATIGPDLSRTRGIITLAQTGWWGRARPARQHVQYSRLRAMETGRPLLIASVSGPTTLVDPAGTPNVLAPYGDAAVASIDWPMPHPPGLYVRTAPYTDIAWTVIALLLVSVPIRWSS